MKRILLVLCMLAMGLSIAWAQSRVTGTVINENGEPLEGVAILIKGTTVGQFSGTDGNFSLEVPSSNDVLVFSYLGFEVQEVPVPSDQTKIVVTLIEDVLGLDEVIISGQGIGIEKRRLSTTVDVVSSADLEATPIVQLDQMLQAKLPNTQIRLSSGQPGTASIIRTRGPVSANTSTTPIIYVDGVRVDNLNSNPALGIGTGGAGSSALYDIPVESIDRIEYVKGGAATTLYGADAANGVIQIFTKKGTKGQARVNFETQQGAIIGTEDFLYFKNTGDVIFEPGHMQLYRFGIDGGNDAITYNFSGSAYEDDGFNTINEQRRYNFRSGFNAKLSDQVNFSSSSGFTQTFFTRDYNANTSFARFSRGESGRFGFFDDPDLWPQSALDSLRDLLTVEGNLTNITDNVRRFQNSNRLTWTPNSKITTQVGFGLDYRTNVAREIGTNAMLVAKGAVAPGTTNEGYITVSDRKFLSLTGDASVRYTEEVGDFSFITTVGGQFFQTRDEQISIDGSDNPDGSEDVDNAAQQNSDYFLRAVTNYGIYAQENLGFKDRLFLDFGIRFDGNSAFGESIGLVPFPKVGVSYNISEEPWFQNAIPQTAISFLKLRANWGVAGNFPTPFSRDRTFTRNSYLGLASLTFGNPGNDSLGPERSRTIEGGFDLSVLDGRVNVNFTYYDQLTNDAIFTPPPASSSGLGSQAANIGTISNVGYEIATTFKILRSKDVDLDLNISYNNVTNEVIDAGGAPEFSVGGFTFLGSFVKVGESLGYLRGAQPFLNAENQSVDSVARNASLGNTIAGDFGVLSLSFRYKKLSLFISADYQWDAQAVATDDVLRFFRGVNDTVRIPTWVEASFFDLAGLWVEDAHYLKVRTISLNYNFGSLANNRIKNLQLGFNAQNPFNFVTSSFDPEITGSGLGNQGSFQSGGFGYGTESPPRMFIGTVKISL